MLAVITGASSGIGRSIAIALARQRYPTVLIARRKLHLDALARRLSTYAPSIPLPLDPYNAARVESIIRSFLSEHGFVNVLVNCAGFSVYAPFEDHTEDELSLLMRVNFEAAVQMTRGVLPGMRLLAARGETAHVMNI